MATIKAGVVVFAADDTREGILEAREWLKANGFQPDQVRLYRHNGQTLVETLKPWSGVTCSDTAPSAS